MAGRPLCVVQVAYPFAPVSEDAVGGAEQIVSVLDEALVATGHRSVVIACEGSRVAGELIAVPGTPSCIDEAARAAVYRAVRSALGAAQAAADVIHLHGIDFATYLPPPGCKVLATLHLPVAWYRAEALRPDRPQTWVHGVSAAQHEDIPASPALLPPIANGVPVARLQAARHARRSFALTLGRIAPEKGQHLALQAAHRAGSALLLAGQVFGYVEHRRYFENEVAPLLDAKRRWIGPVGFARKRRLLSAARCLLVPSLAAETSSLVAMEAAACGTPVIAFRAGALPGIVRHGLTGFLVDDVAAMAAAMRRAGMIDPRVCRETARTRFDQSAMTAAYLARYRALAES